MERKQISLRVPEEELDNWDDAVENDEYKNRTALIRKGVKTELNTDWSELSKQSDVSVETEEMENKIDRLEDTVVSMQESMQAVQSMVSYIVDTEYGDGVDLNTEIYELIPVFEDSTEGRRTIKTTVEDWDETPDGSRASEFGWTEDIQAYYTTYADKDVSDSVNRLVSDVPTVRQITIDGMMFVFEVEE